MSWYQLERSCHICTGPTSEQQAGHTGKGRAQTGTISQPHQQQRSLGRQQQSLVVVVTTIRRAEPAIRKKHGTVVSRQVPMQLRYKPPTL